MTSAISVKKFSTVFDGQMEISVDSAYEGSFRTWISRLAFNTRTFLFISYWSQLLRWLMSFGTAIPQAIILFCCWILLKLTEGMHGQKFNSNMSHTSRGYVNWGSGTGILPLYKPTCLVPLTVHFGCPVGFMLQLPVLFYWNGLCEYSLLSCFAKNEHTTFS
jgi:hypothetical protein